MDDLITRVNTLVEKAKKGQGKENSEKQLKALLYTYLTEKGLDASSIYQQKTKCLSLLETKSSQFENFNKHLGEQQWQHLIQKAAEEAYRNTFLEKLSWLQKGYAAELANADDDETRKMHQISIEGHLIDTISQILTVEGLDESQQKVDGEMIFVKAVKPRQKKLLQFLMHSDRKSNHTEAVKWLAGEFGDDYGFKLVNQCVEKIEHPDLTQDPLDVSNIDELIAKIRALAKKEGASSKGFFYTSVAYLLSQFKEYQITRDELKSKLEKVLHSLIPMSASIFCLQFFITEIALAYSLSAVFALAGKKLEGTNVPVFKELGGLFVHAAKVTTFTTTAIICASTALNLKLTSLGFDSSRYIYHIITNGFDRKALDAQEMIPEECLGGDKYDNKSIKLIAYPLEQYNAKTRTQMRGRRGHGKVSVIEDALVEFHKVDKLPSDLKVKFSDLRAWLSLLMLDSTISGNGGNAVKSVSQSIDMLTRLERSLLDKNEIPVDAIIKPLETYINKSKGFWSSSETTKAKKSKLRILKSEIQTTALNDELSKEAKLASIKEKIETLQKDAIIKAGRDPNALRALAQALLVLETLTPLVLALPAPEPEVKSEHSLAVI